MNYYIDVLKKYVVFGGRAARKEYWMFFLFNIIISFVLAIIDGIAGTNFETSGSAGAASGGVLQILYGLAVFLPSWAVTFRRLHDTDKSGWWLLILLVPFGVIVLLVFMILDSGPGANKYGPNPKEPAVAGPVAAAPGVAPAAYPPAPAAPVTGTAYPPPPSTPMDVEPPAPVATVSAPPPPPTSVVAPPPPPPPAAAAPDASDAASTEAAAPAAPDAWAAVADPLAAAPASEPAAFEPPAASAPPVVDESSGTLEQHCSQCGAAIGGSDEFCQACGLELSGGEHVHTADEADAAGDGPATA